MHRVLGMQKDHLKIIVHVSYDCNKISPEGTYSFIIER